jgi:hypothetical protein
MHDWIDFGRLQASIQARIFGFQADHNLADNYFTVKSYQVSDYQFDLWVTAPDKYPPTSRTIFTALSAPERVYEWLEKEYEEWCSRTKTEAHPLMIREVFEGGSFSR